MKPVRVVTIAPTPHLDGPGRVILGILKHLDRDRFAPFFLSLIRRPASACHPTMREPLEALGVPYRFLNWRKPADLLSPVMAAAVLRREGADVVHTHLLRGHVFGRTAAVMAGVKAVVSTVHGTQQWMESHPLFEGAAKVLDRLTAPIASVVTAVSEEVREALVGRYRYPARKVMVIPNGIDMDGLAPCPEKRRVAREALHAGPERFVVGFVGRLEEQKNPFLLVEVMRRVAAERPGAVAVLLGTGSLEGRVAARIRELNLEGVVRLLGYRHDARELLQGFDAFLLPSRWEGHSLALLEAAASGLPWVAADVGGASLMSRRGGYGAVVPPGDGAAMARAILHIIDHWDEAAARARAAGRDVRERFSEEAVSRRYQDLYQRLAGSARGACPCPAGEGAHEAV